MGYLQQVIKSGPSRYTLPRVGAMKTEVHAFLSETLFNQTAENLWQQAADSASTPGAIGMYLMPDTHLGYHLPVGGVLVTEDVILQAGSGYDINCGVLSMVVPGLTAEDVADWGLRTRWVSEVEKRIAMGVGQGNRALRSARVEEILRYGGKAIGVQPDLCERQYIPIPENIDFSLLPEAFDKATTQVGSLGAGNHFLEMQVDRDDGSVWVMIHCGSRGVGHKTATHFFYEGSRLRGLPPARKEESWLRADEPLGKLYWAWHNAAANFAIANRWTIVQGVQEALQEVFKVRAKPFFEISHNLVQEETVFLPDGTTKQGFVHRKGATRAFPAGHPGLQGTQWSQTGHPCLIPGSMLAGGAILFPKEGAYQSGCSVNHGSGRLLGRAEAKRELGLLQSDINDEMRSISRVFGPEKIKITGIASNCANIPLDESGHAYKDLDQVLSVLEDEGIAKIERRLYPVANLKSTD